MKNSILKTNEQVLIAVLKGERCLVLCRTSEILEDRVKNFINLLNKFDISYKIEDNKIRIKEGFVVFEIK